MAEETPPKPTASRRAPASATAPEERNPAGEEFELSRWMQAGVLDDPPHVIEGAAALAGWDRSTKLSRAELRSGIQKFLNHTPKREE